MYLADYHLHSTCSPDGKLTVAQIAEIALARGLQEICITDHLDTIYWGTYAPRTDFDWPALQQQGVEVLYGPIYAEHWQTWLTENGHFIDNVRFTSADLQMFYGETVRSCTKTAIF